MVQLQPTDIDKITTGSLPILFATKLQLIAPPSSAIVPKSWRGAANSKAPLCAQREAGKEQIIANNNIGKRRFTAQSYIFFNFFHKIFGG